MRNAFSHVNPSQLSIKRANVNVAREKGAVTQVCINSVTIVRKKFSEVCGIFRALYSSSRPFSTIFLFPSKETRLKAVDFTYCVPRNILIFTGFSSTALLTCS